MSNRNTNEAVSTGDSLGLGAENPRVRLRSNQNLSRRSEGIIFGDDFQVTADQEEADKDLVKQVYHEVEKLSSISTVDGACVSNQDESTTAAAASDPSCSIPSLETIEKKYLDIARFKIFQLAGDDVMGRPVIAFSACRMPVRDLIDHQRLIEFAKATLDHYVVNDYTLVYFHYGLNSQNKPSFSWLLQIYRELDRTYKKNIKAFYVVHPSNFIKVAYAIMQPFLSKKFGKKIHNINRLDDLIPYIRLGQLDIPKDVRDIRKALVTPRGDAQFIDEAYSSFFSSHDELLIAKSKAKPTTSMTSSFYVPPEIPKTQQFGVTLKTLIENSVADPIPIVIRTCVEFLREHGLTTEGIFRRSPLSTTIEELKRRFNQGENVQLDPTDIHAPAVLIKKFLREMPEPVLTFEFLDVAMDICALPQEERVNEMRMQLKKCLPEENYELLTYIVRFLEQVVDNQAENRMTTGNLAIIFGPNLLWSKYDTTSLTFMAKLNTFTKVLLDNSKSVLSPDIFIDKN